MKKIMKTLTLIGLLAGAIGVGTFTALQRDNVEAEAATVETKRVWATAKDISWWFNNGAQFGIETKVGTTYTKYIMVQEVNNNVIEGESSWPIYYLDIPTNIEAIQWFRKVGSNEYNFTGFTNYGTGLFYIKQMSTGLLSSGHLFNTTKIVSDFAATIDTSAEACSGANAQAAVNAYNNLSTFEQDQFDVLDVGGGVTGLQRLNFLKSFYSIATPPNVIDRTETISKESSLGSIILLSGLSITALGGYFFLQKKKFL